METCRASSDETSQMWSLNKRLEAYLSRVKALEEENELLRAQIHALKAKPEAPSVRKYHEQIMELRDALDDGHQRMLEVETDRDNLYREIEAVREMCLQEKRAREDAKRELSESKKVLEEETRAQTWLREKLRQLEDEVEDILRVHEEEKATMQDEISDLAQRMDFKVAPTSFQPVNVQDYAAQLSQIWHKAVEEYKSEVSALEDSLAEADHNLRKVQEENKQSRLQLQNLDRELQSLRTRKDKLEDMLAKQWLDQQEEEGKLQMEMEALEKEKQDLRAQIAQVLEDRQQLMHLKMSLSLEVATYRSLLEAESTRIYSPTADHKLSSPFSDLMLEKTPLRKRQFENTKTVTRDYRATPTKRQSAEKNELLLAGTPSCFQNIKNTSFSSRPSPVTKEFQKVSSVLKSHSVNYTKASGEKAAMLASVESSFKVRPQKDEVFRKKVETFSKSYSQGPSKSMANDTVKLENNVQPTRKNIYKKEVEVETSESVDRIDNGILLPGEEEHLKSSLEIIKDIQPVVNDAVSENRKASTKVIVEVQKTVETDENETVEHIIEQEELVREVVSCQRVVLEEREVVQLHENRNMETAAKENKEERADDRDSSEPVISVTNQLPIDGQEVFVERKDLEPPAEDFASKRENVICQEQDFEGLSFDLEHAVSPSSLVTKQLGENQDIFTESQCQEEDVIINQKSQEVNALRESTNKLFTNDESEKTTEQPSDETDNGISISNGPFEEYTKTQVESSQVSGKLKEIDHSDLEVIPETQILEQKIFEGEISQQKPQIYDTKEISKQFSNQLEEEEPEIECKEGSESLTLSDIQQVIDKSTFTDEAAKFKAEEDTTPSNDFMQDAGLFENVVDTQVAEQIQVLHEPRDEQDQSTETYEQDTELSEDNQSKVSDHSVGVDIQPGAELAEESQEQPWNLKQESITEDEPKDGLQSGDEVLAEESQEQLWDLKQESIAEDEPEDSLGSAGAGLTVEGQEQQWGHKQESITEDEPEDSLGSAGAELTVESKEQQWDLKQESIAEYESEESLWPGQEGGTQQAAEIECETSISQMVKDEPEIVTTVQESQDHDVVENVPEDGKTESEEKLEESVAFSLLKQEVGVDSLQEKEPSHEDLGDAESQTAFEQESEDIVQWTEKETVQETHEVPSFGEQEVDVHETEPTFTSHHMEEYFNKETEELIHQDNYVSISKTVEQNTFVVEEDNQKEYRDSEADSGTEFETSQLECKEEQLDEGEEKKEVENNEAVSSVEECATSELTHDDADADAKHEIRSESYISTSECFEDGKVSQECKDLGATERPVVDYEAITDTECNISVHQESTEEYFEEGIEEKIHEEHYETVSKTAQQDVTEEHLEDRGTEAYQEQIPVEEPLADMEEQQKNYKAAEDEEISQEIEEIVLRTFEQVIFEENNKVSKCEGAEHSKPLNELEEASQATEVSEVNQEMEGNAGSNRDAEAQLSFQLKSDHNTFEKVDDEAVTEEVPMEEGYSALEEIKEASQLVQSESDAGEQESQLNESEAPVEPSVDLAARPVLIDEVELASSGAYKHDSELDAEPLNDIETKMTRQENEDKPLKQSEEVVSEVNNDVSKTEGLNETEEKETLSLIQEEVEDDQKIAFSINIIQNNLRFTSDNETEIQSDILNQEIIVSSTEFKDDSGDEKTPDSANLQSYGTVLDGSAFSRPISEDIFFEDFTKDIDEKKNIEKGVTEEFSSCAADINKQFDHQVIESETTKQVEEQPADKAGTEGENILVELKEDSTFEDKVDEKEYLEEESVTETTSHVLSCAADIYNQFDTQDLESEATHHAEEQHAGTTGTEGENILEELKEEVSFKDNYVTKDEIENIEEEIVTETAYQGSSCAADIINQFDSQDLASEPSKQVEEQPVDIPEIKNENKDEQKNVEEEVTETAYQDTCAADINQFDTQDSKSEPIKQVEEQPVDTLGTESENILEELKVDKDITKNREEQENIEEVVIGTAYQVSLCAADVNNQFDTQDSESEPCEQIEEQPAGTFDIQYDTIDLESEPRKQVEEQPADTFDIQYDTQDLESEPSKQVEEQPVDTFGTEGENISGELKVDKGITKNKDEKENIEEAFVIGTAHQVSSCAADINNQFDTQDSEPEASEKIGEQPADETEGDYVMVERHVFSENPSTTLDVDKEEPTGHQSDIEDENSKSDASLDSQGISLYSQSEDFEISKDYQLEQTLPDSTPLPNLDEEFEDLVEEDHILITAEQAQNVTGSQLASESKNEEELESSLESQSSETIAEMKYGDDVAELKQDSEALDDNTFGISEEPTFAAQNHLEDKEVSNVENDNVTLEEPLSVKENDSLEKGEIIEAGRIAHLEESLADTPLSDDKLMGLQSEDRARENIKEKEIQNQGYLSVDDTEQNKEITPAAESQLLEIEVPLTNEDDNDFKPDVIISEDIAKSKETEDITEDESDTVTKQFVEEQSTELTTDSYEIEEDSNKGFTLYGNNEAILECKDNALIKTSKDDELKDVEKVDVQDAKSLEDIQANVSVLKHPPEERIILESDDSLSSDETSPNASFSLLPETEENRSDVILESVQEGFEECETAELEGAELKETHGDEVLLTTKAGEDSSSKRVQFQTSDEEKETLSDNNDSSFDTNSGNEQEPAEEPSTENHITMKAMNGHHEHTIVQATLDFEDPFMFSRHSTLEQGKIVISEKTIVKVKEDIIDTRSQDLIEESVLKFAASEGKGEGLFQSLLEKSELKEGGRLDEPSEFQKTLHAAFEYMDSAAGEGSFTKKVINPYLDDNQSELKSDQVSEDLISGTGVQEQSTETYQQEKEDFFSLDE